MTIYKSETYDFNSILDKDLVKTHIQLEVELYNKNGTTYKTLGYSQSFSIDEIYKTIQKEYPNKRALFYFNILA